VFTHKSESVRSLLFEPVYRNWGASKGHRQSRTLENW